MSCRGISKLASVVRINLRKFSSSVCSPAADIKAVEREVKEVSIPVPWGHIAGKWWGPFDVKPVLALHGWQDNANTWDNIVPLLSPNISLLCIDLVGHGLSSHYPAGMSYHQVDYVGLVRRLVKYYGWDKVSLLGHSMGSIISFVYSCVYPDEVNNYIAVEAFPPISRTPDSALRHWAKTTNILMDVFTWKPEDTPTYTYENAIEQMCLAHKDSLTKDSAKVLLRRGATRRSDGTYCFTRDPRIKYMFIAGWPRDLIVNYSSSIKANVLHIGASSGLTYEEPEHYNKSLLTASKSAKRFEQHVVEGTHHVHLNNPERVAPIINKFLSNATI